MFNLNGFPGILHATTAGDLATLLGIVHLLLPAITAIFQGKCLLQHSLNVLVHLSLFFFFLVRISMLVPFGYFFLFYM
jgi:hypothetical protein